MNEQMCVYSDRVLEACHSGQWPEEVMKHAQTCPSCSWLREMDKSIRQISDTASAEISIPTFRFMTTQVNIAYRMVETRRSLHLMRLTQLSVVALTVIIGGLAAFAAGFKPSDPAMLADHPLSAPVLLLVLFFIARYFESVKPGGTLR